MFLALMLAAATAAKPAPAPAPATGKPAAAQATSLDVVPIFIGACMSPGPVVDDIKAAVIKAGGKPAPQAPGSPPPADGLEGYLFDNGGLPFSVLFDKQGTCSVVAGRVDVAASRASLEHLVNGSAEVFDVSRTDAKAHVEGETVLAEYKMTSKNKKGGLQITLSSITREGKGTAVFLTRRIFTAAK